MNRLLRPCLALALVLSCMAAATTATYAQIERQISYQGLLTLPTGLPLDDGRYDLVLRMYDAGAGGNLLWEETQSTTITKGLFNLYLGSVVPLNGVDFFNTQVYLETALAGQPPFPRTRLAVVPYAIRAERAGIADSINITTARGFVRTLNGAEGDLVINGRNGVSVTRTGDSIFIESTITIQGIQSLTSPQNTIDVVNPSGPNTTIDVRDGAITTAKLADSVATTVKIANNAITTTKIANGAITATKIAAGVIPTTLPPNGPAGGDLTGTYPNPTIALSAVTTPKLADGSVTTNKIVDGSVTTPKIADNSITTFKVLDGAITAPKLTTSGVTAGTYGDALNIPRITVDDKGRVTLVTVAPLTNFPFIVAAGGDLTGTYPNPLIRTNAVTTDKILDFNVTTSKIADLAITTPKIAIGAVRSEQVADGSLTVLDLAPGTIPTTLPPSGPAGGDFTGSYPNPQLSTSAATGSRIVGAIRADYLAGDANINTANNIVVLDGLGRFPARDGSLITNISASNITTGVLPIANGGTNSSTPLNNNRTMVSSGGRIVEAPQELAGQFLIGTGPASGPAVGQIIAGTGMSVTYSSPNIVIASTTQPGTLVDQTLRWDTGANAWVPTSNVLSSATGNLTIAGNVSANGNISNNGNLSTNGNTTLGDNAGDLVTVNAATVKIANVGTGAGAAGVLTRNAAGNIEVSTATFTTSATALAANAGLRTNAAGQIETVALTNGQLLIGNTGGAPTAATITGTANQVIVTNGAGSITLSTPQNIATTSNVTFNSLTTTNNVSVGTSLAVSGAATVGGTLGVTGATTLSSTLTQTGIGQVTFGGNVDATNGLDVTGANLTVGGSAFTVNVTNGNVVTGGTLSVAGNANVDGNVTLGNGSGDNVTIDVSGGAGSLRVNGLPTVAGTDVMMINGTNVVSRQPITALINADNGITYNEAGSGMVRLGATTTFGSPLVTDRYVNLGNNDLYFTTSGGLANILWLNGDAANYGATLRSAGTGSVELNGSTRVVGPLTQQSGTVTLNGATVVANTLTQTGAANQVTFGGNVDANNGLDVTGAMSVAGTLFQTGAANQVSFAGNVDATNGLDVTGANLTVGGTNFVVATATGNTGIAGTLGVGGAATMNNNLAVVGNTALQGNVAMGNGNGDVIAMDVSGVGGSMTIAGLPAAAGTDLMMVGAGNLVSRSPITSLIDADNGVSYNEAGSGKIRLGATTALLLPLTGNRFVNLGVSDLTFTTSNGTANLVVMDGDATNYGLTVNANGTGSIALNGRTNITGQTTVVGATTVTGAITQNGSSNQVTFNGNVDATNGLDVTGANLTVGGAAFSVGVATGNTVVGGTLAVSGNATMNGNVTMGNGTNDNVTIDVSGGTGQLKVSGLATANGTSLLVIDNTDVVTKTPITNLIAADNGITYNEAGSGMIRLGSTATNVSTMTANRFVNMGNNDLAFTTNGGLNNVLLLDGDAANYGITVNAGGTRAIALNGATNIVGQTTIVGNTSVTGTVTQNGGGQVTFSGNVDANLGLDVVGAATVNGPTTLTGNLNQSAGTVTLGGATTIAGATAVNNTLSVTGNATLSSNLSVNGTTTLGDASADAVTVNAGTVSMPNIGTTVSSNDFIMSTAGGVLAKRTINNIVTGTGTQDRMTRWGVGGNNIVDASLSDNGTGTLSRVGNIALNPGTGNTLSTNGSLTVAGSATVTGNTTMNGAVNVGDGNDAVAVNVTNSSLTIAGLNTATGTDLLMINGSNSITRSPITSLINAEQGVTYNEAGSGNVRLGSTSKTVSALAGTRYVNLANYDLIFTTNSGNSNLLVLDGDQTNFGVTVNPGGTGKFAVNGSASVSADLTVGGTATVTGLLTGNGGLSIAGNSVLNAQSSLGVGGYAEVSGSSTFFRYDGSGGERSMITLDPLGVLELSSDDGTNSSTLNITGGLTTIGDNLYFAEIDNATNQRVKLAANTKSMTLTNSGLTISAPTSIVGNTNITGDLTVTQNSALNGNVTLGDGSGDAVTADVSGGGSMKIIGLPNSVGTFVVMTNGSDVVSKTAITNLINANQGLTYNEGGSAMVQLGSGTSTTASTMTGTRNVNVGAATLNFTTNGGSSNLVRFFGGTTNYGVELNAVGTGTLALNGATNITGATGVVGALSQSGGSVTLSGATTVNNTLAVTGATTLSSTLNVTGNSTLTGNLTVNGTTALNNAVTQSGGTVSLAGNTTISGSTTLTGTATMTNALIRMTNLPAGAAADEIVSINVATGAIRRSTAAALLNDDVWLLDGNTNGGTKTMGSNDNFDIGFETNGTTRLTITSDGRITQNGANQVAFAGNVDANNGLDVAGANLTVGGNKFTVDVTNGNTTIAGTLDVTGATTLSSTLAVSGNTTLGGTLGVTGASTLNGATTINNTLTQTGSSNQVTFAGNVDANNGLDVAGANFTVGGNKFTVDVTNGNTSIAGTLGVTGATTLSSTLAVTGTSTLNGATTINNTLTQTGSSNQVTFAGNVDANNGLDVAGANLTVGGNKFTVDVTNGNTSIAGTLGVTGATTLSSTLAVSGNTTIGGTLGVTGATTLNNTLTQTGTGQVTFGGNVDANNGLDVVGANLTVGGNKFTVDVTNGNTTIAGTLGVTGATTLSSTLAVSGNTTIGGTLGVTGATTLNNTLTQTGSSNQVTFAGNVDANNGLDVAGANLTVGGNKFTVDVTNGNTTIAGTLGVTGATTLSSTLAVSGNTTVGGTLGVTGATTLNNTLTQTGSSNQVTFAGNVDANNGLDVAGANLTVGGNKFTVDVTNGNTTIAGTLDVTGATTLSSTLAVTGNTTIGGTLGVTGASTLNGATTINNTLTQTGSTNQVTFAGNVDANNGLDVAGANLTVGGNKFTVDVANGNTAIAGTLNVTGATSLSTLSTSGAATFNSASVTNNLTVGGNTTITGTLGVTGATTLNNTLTQNGTGQVTFGGNVDANNGLDVAGANFTVGGNKFIVDVTNGNTTIAGTLGVTGATTLSSTLAVTGTSTLNGATTINNTLTQTGSSNQVTFAGNVDANNGLDVAGANLTVGGNKFTVNVANGNTSILGTLNVTGATTLNSTLTQNGTGQVTFGGNVDANKGLDVTGGNLTVGTNKFIVDFGTGNTSIAGKLDVTGDMTTSGNVSSQAPASYLIQVGTVANGQISNGTELSMTTSDARLIADDGTNFTSLVIAPAGATFNGSLDVQGDFSVGTTMFTVNAINGNTAIAGTLGVTGATTLNNSLTQTGTGQVTFAGNVDANNGLDVAGANLTVGGNKFTVDVTNGNTLIAGTLGVTGATTLSSTLAVTGNTTIGGTLGVTGASTLNGATTINNTLTQTGSSNQVTFAGNVDANNGLDVAGANLTVGGNKFTVDVANGNTAIAGTLNVTGATSLSTLSTSGAATFNSASVTNNLTVGGNTTITGTLGVTGATTLNNTLTQNGTGQVTFGGNVDANNGLDVVGANLTVGGNKFTVDVTNGNTLIAGTLGVTGATTLSSTLGVTGNTTIGGTLGVTGATTLSSTLAVTGNTTIGGTLGVTGASTLNGATTINNTLTQTGSSNQVTFAGNVDANNGLDVAGANLTVGGNKFTVDVTNGNTLIAGTLGVTGATTLSSTLGVTGNTTIGGTLGVTGATTLSSTLAVTGNTTIGGTLGVTGASTLDGATTINNTLTQTGSSNQVTFAGNVDANNGLDVSGANLTVGGNKFTVDVTNGNTSIAGTLDVTGATTLSSTLAVAGNTTISGTLDVTGATTLNNTLTQTGTGQVTFGGNVDANNGLDVAGANLTVGGNKFTVDVTNGNAVSKGDLTVEGNTYLGTNKATDNLVVNATTSITGDVTINGALTQSAGAVNMNFGDLDLILDAGVASIGQEDATTVSKAYFDATSAEIQTSTTVDNKLASVKTKDDGSVTLTSSFNSGAKVATVGLTSTSNTSSITATAETVTMNAANTVVNGNLSTGGGSNKFAGRLTLSGQNGGMYSFTITNTLIQPNSVIVMTLESYSGSGILLHQIQSRTNGSVVVALSQPLFVGESVIVNYMIVNQ